MGRHSFTTEPGESGRHAGPCPFAGRVEGRIPVTHCARPRDCLGLGGAISCKEIWQTGLGFYACGVDMKIDGRTKNPDILATSLAAGWAEVVFRVIRDTGELSRGRK